MNKLKLGSKSEIISQIEDSGVDQKLIDQYVSEVKSLKSFKSLVNRFNSDVDKLNAGGYVVKVTKGKKVTYKVRTEDEIQSDIKKVEKINSEIEELESKLESAKDDERRELEEKLAKKKANREEFYQSTKDLIGTLADSTLEIGKSAASGNAEQFINSCLDLLGKAIKSFSAGMVSAVMKIKKAKDEMDKPESKDKASKIEAQLKDLEKVSVEIESIPVNSEPISGEEWEDIKSESISEEFEDVGKITNWESAFKYGFAKLKQVHGENYDQEIANNTLNGLKEKYPDNPNVVIGALKFGGHKESENLNNSRGSNKVSVTFRDEDGESIAKFDSMEEADKWINFQESNKSSGAKFEVISVNSKSSEKIWSVCKLKDHNYYFEWLVDPNSKVGDEIDASVGHAHDASIIVELVGPGPSNEVTARSKAKCYNDSTLSMHSKFYRKVNSRQVRLSDNFDDAQDAYEWLLDEEPGTFRYAYLEYKGKVIGLSFGYDAYSTGDSVEKLFLHSASLPGHFVIVDPDEWEGRMGEMFDHIHEVCETKGERLSKSNKNMRISRNKNSQVDPNKFYVVWGSQGHVGFYSEPYNSESDAYAAIDAAGASDVRNGVGPEDDYLTVMKGSQVKPPIGMPPQKVDFIASNWNDFVREYNSRQINSILSDESFKILDKYLSKISISNWKSGTVDAIKDLLGIDLTDKVRSYSQLGPFIVDLYSNDKALMEALRYIASKIYDNWSVEYKLGKLNVCGVNVKNPEVLIYHRDTRPHSKEGEDCIVLKGDGINNLIINSIESSYPDEFEEFEYEPYRPGTKEGDSFELYSSNLLKEQLEDRDVPKSDIKSISKYFSDLFKKLKSKQVRELTLPVEAFLAVPEIGGIKLNSRFCDFRRKNNRQMNGNFNDRFDVFLTDDDNLYIYKRNPNAAPIELGDNKIVKEWRNVAGSTVKDLARNYLRDDYSVLVGWDDSIIDLY